MAARRNRQNALRAGAGRLAKPVAYALAVLRDLTFWQLNFRTNTPLQSSGIETSRLSDLFLRQFDRHFDMRDGEMGFHGTGQRARSWRSAENTAKRRKSGTAPKAGQPPA